MSDLERELRELGREVEFPPTPDLATEVRRRIAAEPAPRSFPLRRPLVLGLALLAVAVGATLAVPQARTAILEWLGLRGVTIERTPTQPTAPREAKLGLGERVSLDEAQRRLDFPVLVPSTGGLEEVREVRFDPSVSGGQVGFVYRSDGDVRALLTQFRASLDEQFIHKAAGPDTEVERVAVKGQTGFWLEGAPHEFFYVTRDGEPRPETLRLAGNTLLWEAGDRTLRLEGDFTKTEALAIARSMRPAGS